MSESTIQSPPTKDITITIDGKYILERDMMKNALANEIDRLNKRIEDPDLLVSAKDVARVQRAAAYRILSELS